MVFSLASMNKLFFNILKVFQCACSAADPYPFPDPFPGPGLASSVWLYPGLGFILGARRCRSSAAAAVAVAVRFAACLPFKIRSDFVCTSSVALSLLHYICI